MRTVMVGIVVAALLGGCDENGQPAPVAPTCEESTPTCPEGMTAACDGEGAGRLVTRIFRDECMSSVEGFPAEPPTCSDGGAVACDLYSPACVEAPSTDPADCDRWAAECAAMGETSCYVVAGTDDVIPD